MDQCRFTFSSGGPIWEGFADGTTWNGFDNVAVTVEAFNAIKAHFQPDEIARGLNEPGDWEYGPNPESRFCLIDGLVALGWMMDTTIEHYPP